MSTGFCRGARRAWGPADSVRRVDGENLADDEPIEQHAESRRGEKPIAAPQSVKTTESAGHAVMTRSKAFCFSYRPAARVKLSPDTALPNVGFLLVGQKARSNGTSIGRQ